MEEFEKDLMVRSDDCQIFIFIFPQDETVFPVLFCYKERAKDSFVEPGFLPWFPPPAAWC